jgi:hypothetical protein
VHYEALNFSNLVLERMSTKRDTRSLSYFVRNATFRLQRAQFSTMSTHCRRPVLKTPGLYSESLGFKPGNMPTGFSVFFLRPYRKTLRVTMIRFGPTPQGTINLTVRRHSSARQRRKKNPRIWKLLSFVRLHKLVFASQTTKHSDTDMNTGSCTRIINCVYLYPTG